MTTEQTVLMDGEGIKRALTRIAHEILERNKGVADIVLIGIRSGGAFLDDADLLCNPVSQKCTARTDTDQHNICNPFIAFKNFVSNASQSSLDSFTIHKYGLFSSHLRSSSDTKKEPPRAKRQDPSVMN